uniref:Uncharacterized protein n=1 Tax=Anguilla anguilla TaxID=7936 RepID=A0A0E9Y1H5_ANGAN
MLSENPVFLENTD